MTLVELLIVVTILLLAAAIFVPRLQPLMDHSKVREAARVVQLYMSTARNRAMATGRSCGVMIEPLLNDTGCAMTLSQVETPPPYSGSTQASFATVTFQGMNANYANCKITLTTLGGQADGTFVPLHQGDMIQVGYQGYWMLLANAAPLGATALTASLDISHGETPAWLTQPVTGPYKILRWPTKSAAPALQLPGVTCIDLTWSGFDPTVAGGPATWPIQTPPPTAPALPTPVIISFAADGRVDWVSTWKSPAGQPAITPVYLLVGMRKKVFDSPTDPNIANTNLNDFNSLWLSIDSATGLILISDPAAIPANVSSITPTDIGNSRANARQALANGGGK
jgi:type II secretory pathway pseudopilin PulG